MTFARLLLGLLVAAGLGGCQSAPRPAPAMDAPSPAEASALADAVSDIFERTPLLVLGEIHGTNEIPAFALAALDAASASGEVVGLGLEMGEASQGAMDAYVNSSGGEAELRALLSTDHWEYGGIDGRGSLAMLQMIEGVRVLREKGRSVSIRCFVVEDLERFDEWEELMATSVLDWLEARSGAKMIALVGNAHAQRVPYEDSSSLSMGHYLVARLESTVTLNARTAGGESWIYVEEPGVHPVGGTGQPETYGIDLFETPSALGFDGAFDVGVTTASMPVKVGAYERMQRDLGIELSDEQRARAEQPLVLPRLR